MPTKQVAKKPVKKQTKKQTKKTTKQMGGAVLGKGRDGCVISHPIVCNSAINKIGKVSKIFDLSKVSPKQQAELAEEYEIGKTLRAYDKESLFFLPGIDLCYVRDPRAITNEKIKTDLKDCGINFRDNRFKLMSITMPNGQNFKEVLRTLDELDILKCLGYVLSAARHCIYDIGFLLGDVKGKNLLFRKYQKKFIHPVFIDFSSDYVVTSKREFLKFMSSFSKGGRATRYLVLPNEIFIYDYFLNYGKKDLRREAKALSKFRGINLELTSDFEESKEIFWYMHEKLRERGKFEKAGDYLRGSNNPGGRLKDIYTGFKDIYTGEVGLKHIFDKIMSYSIGYAFRNALLADKDDFIIKNNSIVLRLLDEMVDDSIIERKTIVDTLKYISETLNVRNVKQLMLKFPNLTTETQKIINKTEKDRNTIEKEIEKGRKKQYKNNNEYERKRYMSYDTNVIDSELKDSPTKKRRNYEDDEETPTYSYSADTTDDSVYGYLDEDGESLADEYLAKKRKKRVSVSPDSFDDSVSPDSFDISESPSTYDISAQKRRNKRRKDSRRKDSRKRKRR